MKALLFPGQGSQYVGMAKDFYEQHSESRELLDAADRLLGFSITDIMFTGDDARLKQTRYTQLAIFLHSTVAAQFIDREDMALAAGHSLGEYSALHFSQAIDFEDALRVVAKRGLLMQEAGEKLSGSMAAIIGLTPEKIDAVLKEAGAFGTIQAANFNSPGQVVISGATAAVHQSLEIAKAHGARLAKELAVSGAFHSPLMKPAELELAAELNRITIHDARTPVCMNVSATLVTNADEIRENLVKQLTSPVLWEQSVRQMIQSGVREFIEAGPQKVLQGLVKRIDGTTKQTGIDTFADAEALRSVHI
ncbi:MAG: ACP S-malonyltransferase [Rhizobacter sp.]|nr:ACP S-malonyltransferase [Chlorobiales bacterium]